MAHNKTWYYWIWGRQDFGDYALLVFDICTQKKFGYTRMPMFFLEDKDGNLLLEQLTPPKCRIVSEYTDENGKTVTCEGDMIYEFVYMGMNYRARMENL